MAITAAEIILPGLHGRNLTGAIVSQRERERERERQGKRGGVRRFDFQKSSLIFAPGVFNISFCMKKYLRELRAFKNQSSLDTKEVIF